MAMTSLRRYATFATASLPSMVLNLHFMASPYELLYSPDRSEEKLYKENEGPKRYCRGHGSQGGVMCVTSGKCQFLSSGEHQSLILVIPKRSEGSVVLLRTAECVRDDNGVKLVRGPWLQTANSNPHPP